MSSKGTIFDLMTLVIALFVAAIAIIMSVKMYDAFVGMYEPKSEAATNIIAKGTIATRRFDAAFLIYTVGLGLAVIIGGFVIYTHPIFLPISLMILGILLLVFPQISNAFESFINNSSVASIGDEFPIMIRIMRNLPTIMTGIGFLVLIAMYIKPRGGI